MRRKIRRLQRCKATPILAFPRRTGVGTGCLVAIRNVGFAHEINNIHGFPIQVIRLWISWAKPTLPELFQSRVD